MSAHAWATWSAIVSLALCGCSTPTGITTGSGNTSRPHHNHTGLVDAPPARDRLKVTAIRSEELSLITEPGVGDKPFIALINSAQHTIQVVMYELTDQRVERALAAAAARGVQVMVLLDHGQYGAGRPLNDAAYRYLATHGVTVAWTPGYFALTHQKSILIDRRVAAIMTLNLTPAYYQSSRDFAVLDRRPADVAAIAQAFYADLHHQQIVPSTGRGGLVWSPGAQASISALIAHARRSLEVESEEMDDPAITHQLCQAAQRGVQVRVMMTYQPAWRAMFTYLARCRAQVRIYPTSAALYIHAKLIRVDGHTVFIGSQNLSRQSLTYNRELGIITQSPQIVASTGRTFSTDFTVAQPFEP
jgi:cardiolipin synthase